MSNLENMMKDSLACGFALFARALAKRRMKYCILAAGGILGVIIALALYVAVLLGKYRQHGVAIGSVSMVIAIAMLLAGRFLPWPKLTSVGWQQAFLVLKPWKTGGLMIGSALPSSDEVAHFALNDRQLRELAEKLPGVPESLDDESYKNDLAARLYDDLNSVTCGTLHWSFIQRNGDLGREVIALTGSRPDLMEDARRLESGVDTARAPAVSARLSAELEIISSHLDLNEANRACLKRCRDMVEARLADSRKYEDMLSMQADSFKPDPAVTDKQPVEFKFNCDEIQSQLSGSFGPVLRDLENESNGIIKELTAGKDRDIADINERLKADIQRREKEAGLVFRDVDQKISALRDSIREAEKDSRQWEDEKRRLTAEMKGNLINLDECKDKFNGAKIFQESADQLVKALNVRMDKLKHERADAEERLKSDIARLNNTAESDRKSILELFEKDVEDTRRPVRETEARRNRILGLLEAVKLDGTPDQYRAAVCDDSETWIRRIIGRRISIIRGACDLTGSCLAKLDGIAVQMQNKFSGSLWDAAVFNAVRSYFFIPFVTTRISHGRKEQLHLMAAPVVEEQIKPAYGGIYWSAEGYEGKAVAEYCRQSYEQKLCFPGFGREINIEGDERKVFLKFVDQAIIDRMVKDRVAIEMLSVLAPKTPYKKS